MPGGCIDDSVLKGAPAVIGFGKQTLLAHGGHPVPAVRFVMPAHAGHGSIGVAFDV
jgi:hypothetical protein